MRVVPRAFGRAPIWLNLTASGMLWGMIVGLGVALLMTLLVVSVDAGESSLSGTVGAFFAGLFLWLTIGIVYGGAVGGVLGFATGLAAGLALAILVRWVRPAAATILTVLVVVSTQAYLGLAIESVGGFWWILPTFAIVPMTMACLTAARDHAERRRDTLAA